MKGSEHVICCTIHEYLTPQILNIYPLKDIQYTFAATYTLYASLFYYIASPPAIFTIWLPLLHGCHFYRSLASLIGPAILQVPGHF